jgi:hypothetical protein
MERVNDLADVVRHEVADYIAPSPNSTMYFVENAEHEAFLAISVPHEYKNKARVVLMARVANGQLIIETDITDRPLYEELLRAGIPRERIVLAYAGENPTPV